MPLSEDLLALEDMLTFGIMIALEKDTAVCRGHPAACMIVFGQQLTDRIKPISRDVFARGGGSAAVGSRPCARCAAVPS